VNNFARTIRDMDTLALDNPIKPLFGATVDQNTHLVNRIPAGMFDKCRDVTVGVGVVIEDGVRFACDKVTIGDTRINEASYCGGRKPLHIGRNVYLGRGVYLDSNGGLTLEDNTLAGAYSQLWTHIEGGDMIQGCAPWLHQERELALRKDAWLVGRVVISNATEIGERAVVLNESNVLKNIPADTTWAGNPAKDVTEKFGPQFEELTIIEKAERLTSELTLFGRTHTDFNGRGGFGLMWGDDVASLHPEVTYFNLDNRTYTKRRTAAEVAFMRFTSGKFTPAGEE
jgi:acetyltransferase-like isoleucine patch superfamily enzyme